VGEEAKKLFDDANKLLDKVVNEKLLAANGIFGLFPATLLVLMILKFYTDESRAELKEFFIQ